eukprot:6203096-Pleurochrysis_carterae.AAC.3
MLKPKPLKCDALMCVRTTGPESYASAKLEAMHSGHCNFGRGPRTGLPPMVVCMRAGASKVFAAETGSQFVLHSSSRSCRGLLQHMQCAHARA